MELHYHCNIPAPIMQDTQGVNLSTCRDAAHAYAEARQLPWLYGYFGRHGSAQQMSKSKLRQTPSSWLD